MKEATGELNMTVITVVAIAAVGAFFYAIIWPSIKANLLAQTHCSSAINCKCDGQSKMCQCQYYDEKGGVAGPIQCDMDSQHGRTAESSSSTTTTTKPTN